MPTEMTHNDFDFYQDLIKPIFQFLLQIKMNTGPTKRISKVVFKESLYIPPEDEKIVKLSIIKTTRVNLQDKEKDKGPHARSRSVNPDTIISSSTLRAASRNRVLN